MTAPTVAELLEHPLVQDALEQAWRDSYPDDPDRRHEEGGWIYAEVETSKLTIRRAPTGARAMIDLNNPQVVPGSVVVATFHTHPNPSAEGWEPGPSQEDIQSAWTLGVPCLIRADDGTHSAGPVSRRGGLDGRPDFPA